MLHPRRLLLAPILALAVALIGGEARGGYVTYSASTPSDMSAGSGMTLSVPAFDTSLGTLQSVTISFSDYASLSGSLTNNSATAQTLTISDDVSLSASFLGSPLLTDELNATRTYRQLASGATANFGTYSLVGNSGSTTIVDSGMLTSFAESPTLEIGFGSSSQVTVTGGDSTTSVDIQNSVGATVSVTYNFFPPAVVPEPASIAMTALGGLLVAAAGYFRKRARAGSID